MQRKYIELLCTFLRFSTDFLSNGLHIATEMTLHYLIAANKNKIIGSIRRLNWLLLVADSSKSNGIRSKNRSSKTDEQKRTANNERTNQTNEKQM